MVMSILILQRYILRPEPCKVNVTKFVNDFLLFCSPAYLLSEFCGEYKSRSQSFIESHWLQCE